MITKKDIIAAAHDMGFEDVGFITADPFDSHREFLLARRKEYGWVEKEGLDLIKGTDPKNILPQARTIIVLLEVYFKTAFPHPMENHFGRCYLDDDRVTRDGVSKRLRAFCGFLRENGMATKVPFNLPHRVAAAKAGMGTFGKNCLFYSSRVARQSSWNNPITVVVDQEFEPDEPTLEMGCPDWCRNACIAACPTRALKGNGVIDPTKCISFLTYYGNGITPPELREAMGLYVYGCDRCQNVCPRNSAWLASPLPLNPKVAARAENFTLSRLLHMDKDYFETKIWPHMFYMTYKDIWRWKMNVARVMGNSLDPCYIDDLVQAFDENSDTRVKGMIAWALGKIGGPKSRQALEKFSKEADKDVAREISAGLG